MSQGDGDSIQEEPTGKSSNTKQEITFLLGAARRPPLAGLQRGRRLSIARLQEEVHLLVVN